MRKIILCLLVAAFICLVTSPADANVAGKIEQKEATIGGTLYKGVITVTGAMSGTYTYIYSSGLFINAFVLSELSKALGNPYAQALAKLSPSVGNEITTTNSFIWGDWGLWENPTNIPGDNIAWVAMNVVPGRTAGWSGSDDWSHEETSASDNGGVSGQIVVGDRFSTTSTSNRIVQSSYEGAFEVWEGTGTKYVSPLVLDIVGNGKLEASKGNHQPHSSIDMKNLVKMDFFNNGFEIAMEWVGPNDGLLVAPKADGSVDATCLFGSNGGYENGFEKLSLWDRNNDDKVSGDELAGLAVWQDKNQNGIAEKEEITNLKDLGITSLNLKFTEFVGSFVRNGKTYKMWDWWPTAIELKKVSSK